jgi:hypothetical protein
MCSGCEHTRQLMVVHRSRLGVFERFPCFLRMLVFVNDNTTLESRRTKITIYRRPSVWKSRQCERNTPVGHKPVSVGIWLLQLLPRHHFAPLACLDDTATTRI